MPPKYGWKQTPLKGSIQKLQKVPGQIEGVAGSVDNVIDALRNRGVPLPDLMARGGVVKKGKAPKPPKGFKAAKRRGR